VARLHRHRCTEPAGDEPAGQPPAGERPAA
jgi:hypothetical protein